MKKIIGHVETTWSKILEVLFICCVRACNKINHRNFWNVFKNSDAYYEVCPESKDTKVLNMYNIFNLQERHCQ